MRGVLGGKVVSAKDPGGVLVHPSGAKEIARERQSPELQMFQGDCRGREVRR